VSSPTERVSALLHDFVRDDASATWMLCDRHPEDAVAFTLVDEDMSTSDITFGELRSRSTRFAAGLVELGVQPGDRVATLMGKGLDFLTAVLGAAVRRKSNGEEYATVRMSPSNAIIVLAAPRANSIRTLSRANASWELVAAMDIRHAAPPASSGEVPGFRTGVRARERQ
jgi:non-ribosomal peptide synthetase component F